MSEAHPDGADAWGDAWGGFSWALTHWVACAGHTQTGQGELTLLRCAHTHTLTLSHADRARGADAASVRGGAAHHLRHAAARAHMGAHLAHFLRRPSVGFSSLGLAGWSAPPTSTAFSPQFKPGRWGWLTRYHRILLSCPLHSLHSHTFSARSPLLHLPAFRSILYSILSLYSLYSLTPFAPPAFRSLFSPHSHHSVLGPPPPSGCRTRRLAPWTVTQPHSPTTGCQSAAPPGTDGQSPASPRTFGASAQAVAPHWQVRIVLRERVVGVSHPRSPDPAPAIP